MLLVKFYDFIGRKMGQAYGLIFKIVIPFLVTFIPIDQISAFLIGPQAKMFDFFLWGAFLATLIWLPKVASAAEFMIIGFALISSIGFGTIDHLWGWVVMIIAAVFLFFKLLFLLVIMIKKANGMYDADNPDEIEHEYVED